MIIYLLRLLYGSAAAFLRFTHAFHTIHPRVFKIHPAFYTIHPRLSMQFTQLVVRFTQAFYDSPGFCIQLTWLKMFFYAIHYVWHERDFVCIHLRSSSRKGC